MSTTKERMKEFVDGLEIFDTHEHLPRREELRDRDTDVLKEYLLHYFNRDLVSAGMPAEDVGKLADLSLPLRQRWQSVEPYWNLCRHTGYGQALDIAVRELYGIPRIDGDTIEELNGLFLKSLQPGWYRHVLKEKCRIRVSITDPIDRGIECDGSFFRTAHRLDYLIRPNGLDALERAVRFTGVRIRSFDDWLLAADKAFSLMFAQGAACMKIGLAYERPLTFRRVTRADAEAAFNRLFEYFHTPEWYPVRGSSPGRELEDYMLHFLLSRADEEGRVVQIHTGMQEGNGNILSNSHPLRLNRLFLEYPRIRFDLFHMSYPYQGELGVLAKTFPNVYADLCWAHIVSPVAARATLKEWLQLVPLSKIFAFGGDYRIVDAVYGHQRIARDNVAAVLSDLIEENVMTEKEARKAASLMFLENPQRVFGLP